MYKRILVAVDETEFAARAAREAIALARSSGGSLVFLHVGDDPLHAERLLEPFMVMAQHAGTPCEPHTISSGAWDVAARVRGEAVRWGADLIVVGTHGRHGLARLFFGSVSEDIASGAEVPVLVVPHVSPGVAIG